MENVLAAFLLTLFAGLSTGIGSLIALFAKRTNIKMLSVALGFSAGVMIYVSFAELFPAAKDSLVHVYGLKQGYWITVISFFGGFMVAAIIDKLIPSYDNPHEVHSVEEMQHKPTSKDRVLYRMGIFSAIAIAVHNFPEGFATFAAALSSVSMGVAIAVAIAIHNIPEGIAVSIPIYYSTGSKKKAFVYSALSGFAEPLGALVGFIILQNFIGPAVMGIVFALVAGIMVFVSLDELLPTAQRYGEHHLSIYGLVAGMMVMAVSLVLFV